MTVLELSKDLSLTVLAGESALSREVTGCYTGDLLSWVMSRVKNGDAWLTVMGNVNAVAVATLSDAACILLVDGASLDEEARKRAVEKNIAVLGSAESSYELAVKIASLLNRHE